MSAHAQFLMKMMMVYPNLLLFASGSEMQTLVQTLCNSLQGAFLHKCNAIFLVASESCNDSSSRSRKGRVQVSRVLSALCSHATFVFIQWIVFRERLGSAGSV